MSLYLVQTGKHKPPPSQVFKIKRMLPEGWAYLHFTDQEVVNYFKENPLPGFDRIAQKFNSISLGAHKADLFRYFFLYVNGGAYLDSDVLLIRGLSSIVQDCDFSTVMGTMFPGTVFNGFLYCAAPRNPLILEALRHLYFSSQADLDADYFYTCSHVHRLISQNSYGLELRLLREAWHTDKSLAIVDDRGEVQMVHYWIEKRVPLSANGYYAIYFLRNQVWVLSRYYFRHFLSWLLGRIPL